MSIVILSDNVSKISVRAAA